MRQGRFKMGFNNHKLLVCGKNFRNEVFLSRRQFFVQIGVLAASQLLPACSFKAEPVTIGLHVWPGYEPLPLAQSMGWLDPKLVKLVQTGSATDSLKLLEEGKIDGAGLTLDEVLRARENGMPLSVVLVCDISAGADMLLARPEIKTLAGIKGHRIGVEDGALGALMLHEILLTAGLKPEDIKPVSLAVDQHADAWKRGDIDAAVTYEPASNLIMKLGGKKLFDSSRIPDTILDVLAVRTSMLDQAHADALRHLVAGHLRALDYINTNPEDASYRLAPHMGQAPEQVLTAFSGLVLPDLENNNRLLKLPTAGMQKSAKAIAIAMIKAGILRRQPNLDDLLHPEYLPRQPS